MDTKFEWFFLICERVIVV